MKKPMATLKTTGCTVEANWEKGRFGGKRKLVGKGLQTKRNAETETRMNNWGIAVAKSDRSGIKGGGRKTLAFENQLKEREHRE